MHKRRHHQLLRLYLLYLQQVMRHSAAVTTLPCTLCLVTLPLQVDVDEAVVQQQARVGVLDGRHVVAEGGGFSEDAIKVFERGLEVFFFILVVG